MVQSVRILDLSEKEIEPSTPNNTNLSMQQRGLSAMVEGFLTTYFEAHEGLLPTTGLYDRVLQEVERPLLKQTLKLVKGNQKKAAEILGMNRNTLRKKLTDLQIDLESL